MGKTVKVSIRFFTVLREIIGKKEEPLEFKDREKVTLNEIIEKLSSRYGRDFNEYVFDMRTGEIKGFLQFLVNGRSASTAEASNIELGDGDILAIIPPISGG